MMSVSPTNGVAFRVHGTPAPQGSKRHVGGGVMVESGGQKLRSWREDVKHAALDAMNGHPPFEGALEVRVTFYLPKPKSVKRDLPYVRPDLDKTVRSLFDAMTAAGVFVDDSQVTDLRAAKRYAVLPGAEVVVRQVSSDSLSAEVAA
jgi:Holliday junction resolvase RusA-like endonuclease